MNPIIYNASLAAGVALTTGGVALVSVPAALVTAGALVIALTLIGALLAGRKRG